MRSGWGPQLDAGVPGIWPEWVTNAVSGSVGGRKQEAVGAFTAGARECSGTRAGGRQSRGWPWPCSLVHLGDQVLLAEGHRGGGPGSRQRVWRGSRESTGRPDCGARAEMDGDAGGRDRAGGRWQPVGELRAWREECRSHCHV